MWRPVVAGVVAAVGLALAPIACGARTGLSPAERFGAGGGDAGLPQAPDAEPPPECSLASDCPGPPSNQCGVPVCLNAVCGLSIERTCDDADPCTEDSCDGLACLFLEARVDQDADGYFATGTAAEPSARLGCGDDCDDARPDVFPGATESCDGTDNDCDQVVDDGAGLVASGSPAVRVSGVDLAHAKAAGLGFDGESFGASFTGFSCPAGAAPGCTSQARGYFRQLSILGESLTEQLTVARVNAESYAGPLAWAEKHYVTAYQDARQDRNYEIYFDVLNRQGQRLLDDVRVSNAEDFSVEPALVWTGTESLVVWGDRRLEGTSEASAIFGQRIAADGTLISDNLRLSPAGMQGESPSIALGQDTLGLAFTSISQAGEVRVVFMTSSPSLDSPSAPTTIDFADPVSPLVTAVNGKYVVTFSQQDVGVGPAIFGAVLSAAGVLAVAPRPVTVGAAHARSHATYSFGDRFVMVWADDLDGVYQLYAQLFDDELSALSPRQRLTNTQSEAYGPAIAPASDGSLGVLFTAELAGQKQVYFTRLACQPL